jgi:carbamoyl-phosphate synthase large subunit
MRKLITPIKVMVAGIGGASLGTEICKSLNLTDKYEIYGCDISSTAYGVYDKTFKETYRISQKNYISEVLNVCIRSGTKFLIPGGEQPNALIGASAEIFMNEGIRVVTNDKATVNLFSDKRATFNKLSACGIPIPKTIELRNADDVNVVGLPCIVKPSTGTGGSAAVFFALSTDEALLYADFIRRNGSVPIAQEYVSDEEGEFTIGVLSLPDGRLVGSIALRRQLDAKLSVAYRGRGGIVSSGYSQGYIEEYPDLCRQAERIAQLIKSRGPINIQGRLRNGVLMPFEINPRFSASTYLRALAGFNEIDILIEFITSGNLPSAKLIKPGWYLRSLTENYVASKDLK